MSEPRKAIRKPYRKKPTPEPSSEPQPRRRRTLPPGTRVPPLWQMGGTRPHTVEDETTPEEES